MGLEDVSDGVTGGEAAGVLIHPYVSPFEIERTEKNRRKRRKKREERRERGEKNEEEKKVKEEENKRKKTEKEKEEKEKEEEKEKKEGEKPSEKRWLGTQSLRMTIDSLQNPSDQRVLRERVELSFDPISYLSSHSSSISSQPSDRLGQRDVE